MKYDRMLGACSAVLILTGLEQICMVMAGIHLGGDDWWRLRLSVAGAFLFLGSHLFLNGPKHARIAAGLLASRVVLRFFLLLQVFSPPAHRPYPTTISIEELESAGSGLSATELLRFSQWFEEFMADQWDRQIEQDVQAGRLDAARKRAHGSVMRYQARSNRSQVE